MSLVIRSATFGLAALLLIGCDENQVDSLDRETQPSVNDRHTISPEAQLPRPESARELDYSVTPPAETPAASEPAAADPATQSPAADPSVAPTSESQAPPAPVSEEPAVEEVPAEAASPN